MGLCDPTNWTDSLYVGSWVTAERRGVVVEPATGEELGRIGVATVDDIATACVAAASAQPAWAANGHERRAEVLRRAGSLLEEHEAEIRDWIVRESGSVPAKAAMEIRLATQECYEAAALPSHPAGEVLATVAPRLSMTRRVPAGVVGVIAPFNFPLILAMRSVAPALALGNAVVLKPDPRTAVCGGAVLAAVFEAAGLPAGALHVLPGDGAAGQVLVTDPRVRVVSFTGSTAAGRAVASAAGVHLKRVHLELGGNSALIVLDDADVRRAVNAAAFGSFTHQGQICMTTGRHLVHESIADEFVRLLSDRATGMRVGDPAAEEVDLGPLIDATQRDRVHELVSASVEGGARVTSGGTFDGLYYRPTVLDDVTVDSPAYANEVFGPVAPVLRFASEQEAVELASASEYGLSLGILTRDPMRGLALAEAIPTGVAHVNEQTVDDEAVAPFGGVGASGTGARFGGAAANIEAFTETRWITVRGEIATYP